MRELRCAGWQEDTQQATLATGVARDCGDVGSVAGWPSGRERNGLQPGQGATELGFPRPAPGEMQSEAARRAGDPSHQSEDPPPEGLGDHGPLGPDQSAPSSGPGYAPSPGPPARRRWRRSAPTMWFSMSDAVLEVAYGVLDLGVAAMIGLQFQRLPIAVGDGRDSCIWRRGRAGNRASASPAGQWSRTGGASGLVWAGCKRLLGDIGGAVPRPVGNGSPVLLWYRLDQVPQAGALAMD